MTDVLDEDWGDFAGDENPAAAALYSKGSDILYQTREGTWVPGKVISVDISIAPPSYCIEVQGNLRETEEWRLKPPFSGIAAQSTDKEINFPIDNSTLHRDPRHDFNYNDLNLLGLNKNNEEIEDFGDFSAALEETIKPPPPPPRSPPAAPSFHSSPRNRTSTASSTPRSPHTGGSGSSTARGVSDGSIEESFRKFLSLAAPNIAHVLEEEDLEIQEPLEHKITENSNNGSVLIHEEERYSAFPANGGPPQSLSPFFSHLAPVHSTLHSSTAHTLNAVQEYGIAWTLILTTAAEKLEQGRLFWTNCENSDVQRELLKISRGQIYFAALGRIYYIASLVRLAAEMQGLLHFVQELEIAWTRCYTAWNSTSTGIAGHIHSSAVDSTGNESQHSTNDNNNTEIQNKPLSWVSIESAKKLGLESIVVAELESIESVAGVLPNLSLDEFPRMLAWSEGLDSILLLPLSVITESVIAVGEDGNGRKKEGKERETVVEWPETSGRQCLCVVANFWLGCVSSVLPELE